MGTAAGVRVLARLNRYTVPMTKKKSRMLEPLAFDEYCRFDTSAFFMRIKRASLYTHKESRSIKNGNIHRKLKVPTSTILLHPEVQYTYENILSLFIPLLQDSEQRTLLCTKFSSILKYI